MARCAIYGAGSLGMFLGAYITKNGRGIVLINRKAAHVRVLNEKGAHITGTVEMTVPVKAITPDQMEGKYDIILLMTKQLQNEQVLTMLRGFLAEDGVIVTLQNGLPEPGIVEIVGSGRTIGCTVEWGTTMFAPRRVSPDQRPRQPVFPHGQDGGHQRGPVCQGPGPAGTDVPRP